MPALSPAVAGSWQEAGRLLVFTATAALRPASGFTVTIPAGHDGVRAVSGVSFVAYFNGGDAVHYFPRGSYGFQQSLGCVELPYAAAEQAWPYLAYGTLVTVSG